MKEFRSLDFGFADDVSNKSEREIEQYLSRIAKKIEECNNAYYNESLSIISDAEYDLLVDVYKNLVSKFDHLAPKNKPTDLVGANVSKTGFKKIKHKSPMLSLDNGFDKTDIENFFKRINNFLQTNFEYKNFYDVCAELKIDGVSFSAIYEDGNFSYAVTRGDGEIGEDITNNVFTIKDLPKKMICKDPPHFIEIRGEIFIEKHDFEKLNAEQIKNGEQKFANPRNAASGSLRQLNHKITESRPLKYFVYSVGEVVLKNDVLDSVFCKSQYDLLEKLRSFGFCVNQNTIFTNSVEELIVHYDKMCEIRENLPFEVDGIVYKINSFEIQKKLGFVSKSPRFAIAHKFPAKIARTRIKDIHIQVGRTGALTPVAELDPVELNGVIIVKASLHNFKEIERMDVRVNDFVFLLRSGDVIPKIESVDVKTRDEMVGERFEIPKSCPSCHENVYFEGEDAILRCVNYECIEQKLQRLEHFVSRNAMNIEGLGGQKLRHFVSIGLIRDYTDILTLREKQIEVGQKIEDMSGFGKKSAQNLFENIEKSKTTTLDKVIFAVGIRHIGEVSSAALAKHCKDKQSLVEKVKMIKDDDLEVINEIACIDGFGSAIVDEIKKFFSMEKNFSDFLKLCDLVEIKESVDKKIDSEISSKNIVFTGNMESHSRSEAKYIAENLGAIVKTQVSSKTDFLIAGKDPGSKLKEAQKLGVKILTEEDWVDIVSNSEKSLS